MIGMEYTCISFSHFRSRLNNLLVRYLVQKWYYIGLALIGCITTLLLEISRTKLGLCLFVWHDILLIYGLFVKADFRILDVH